VRRRDLLLAGAAVALARPAAAEAAEGDVLDRLIVREDAAAFAYRERGVEGPARLAEDHAKALRTQIDALGRRGPLPPTSVRELDPAARRVAEGGAPANAIALQRSLLDAYERGLAELAEPSILRTAATIAASHAQHLALLRREAGLDPFR
jgi:hypothetical protein